MSKIDKEQLIELIREGKTDSECAEVFDCSNQAVGSMRRRLQAEGQLTTETIINAKDYIAEKQLQTDDQPATKTVAERIAEEEAAEAAKRADGKTPDPEANHKEAPYPIPPIDRKTFWDMRRDELRGAICEYACYGLRIDPEWVAEYNELIERCEG